ncbi:MAG: HAMP domain-containing protein [Deltaproteobacteria bacterium]|nr:HAMP domain-containing protein [Deltaproteobacteria bacterium]
MTSESRQRRRRRLALAAGLAGAVLVTWVGLALVQGRLFRMTKGGGVMETLVVFGLVNFNILLLLLLLFLTLRNLVKLAFERRRGVLGARLKTKLVLAFVAMTVIPTALLYLASAGFLARSIDSWFSTRVEGALRQSLEVARTYYRGEEQRVLHYARQVAETLPRHGLDRELGGFESLLLARAVENQLGAIAVYSAGGEVVRVVANPKLPVPEIATSRAPEVEQALEGKEYSGVAPSRAGDFLRGAAPVVDPRTGKVWGAVVVDAFIPGRVLDRLQEITAGFEEYRQLEVLKSPIKASYILPLLMVALLIVFAATWIGFYLARGITGPIQALAEATQRVAEGDLDFQLEVTSRDEVGTLVASFNQMTRDLKASEAQVKEAQGTLRSANDELESRRRYMEIVLGRVTAGVVSTDRRGRVTTLNPAAAEMMGVTESAIGKTYQEILTPEAKPVIASLLEEFATSHHDSIQRQVLLPLGGVRRSVKVHLTSLRDEGGELLGAVAVFDDLTELLKAQRAQAWQEVARRMAHEIKNPLTPIQLSAQRLRRRYASLLEEQDGVVLDEATRTIVGQVESLKQLVNEFSRFAKLPETRPAPGDLNRIVGEVADFYRPAHPEIRFEVRLDAFVPTVEVDAEQVKRALVNLLDNSVAALGDDADRQIEIHTEYDPQAQLVRLVVADNGAGLSPEARERLFEPYFSTKKGGTGLGLAIVRSIVQDHRGYIRASDNHPRGTRFVVELPLAGASA